MNITRLLQSRLGAALAGMVDNPSDYASLVKPSSNPAHGDYQANCAMPLAKALGKPQSATRDVAQEIISRLEISDICEPPVVAGPGFINLKLKPSWLAAQAQLLGSDERLGVELPEKPKTIVIDYSSVNVAKPLHVGHLRSTIIGDSLARLMRFLGHRVITDNHLGDWGTQFGMLLYGYKHFRDEAAFKEDPVRELVRIYQRVRQLTKGEEDEEGEVTRSPEEQAHYDACLAETAKLQAGDPENLALWKRFIDLSMSTVRPLYERLGATFDHELGESFYNPMLSAVVEDVLAKKIARPSKGAVVVFEEEACPETEDEDRDKKLAKSIVRKADGAATYTTTDLATIKYRHDNWKPDEILYVVGTPQAYHFRVLFHTARRWGYENTRFHHINFGSVLGNDRRMLSTRNGGATELSDLLEMAVGRARHVHAEALREAAERGEEDPGFSPEELRRIHEVVGIGAVKYADMSQNRASDYTFDLAKMTSTVGNTATYMQYAYARNRSIFRRGCIDPSTLRTAPPLPIIETPHERALALQLLRFPEALEAAAADYRPNIITAYLWDLANAYSGFFQNCPVLRAETPELRQGRLLLCDLTARIIQKGLDLLGIQTAERM
jgi:arginyl-tRNA synthetase